jgi:hypothetical protein
LDTETLAHAGETARAARTVRHLRQILLWPLQLIPLQPNAQIQRHWEALEQPAPDNPWEELADEFGDPGEFQERHYTEFVAFLPHVQRFLYGQGLGKRVRKGYGDSPMRVFRRRDVAQARVTLAAGDEPVVLRVAHVDLYFFYDSDLVMLALELQADDLPFGVAQSAMYQFGRAYPASWNERGEAANCPHRAEWLAADGTVLAVSDFERREKFLSFVCRHRAPGIAAHWDFLLRPLVLHHLDETGLIRFRQLEYYRMPLLAYLAMDDADALTRADYVRLAFVTRPGDPDTLPFAARYLEDFESRYCYDRYREDQLKHEWSNTRLLCSGHAFVMVGSARDPFFVDPDRGLLGQFRHQYFLLSLVVHFHRAALLQLSDRLIVAVSQLDIAEPESVRQFRRSIRQTFEIFLRFTHRYWFHEVSNQVPMRDLFNLWRRHLSIEDLYAEVREELQDMNQYLDSDVFRRHSNTMLRLTVVTVFGLIGSVTTGFLGMNLLAAAEAPLVTRLGYFVAAFLPITALTVYMVMKSRRLSDFLDALSDERVDLRGRWRAFLAIWRKEPV